MAGMGFHFFRKRRLEKEDVSKEAQDIENTAEAQAADREEDFGALAGEPVRVEKEKVDIQNDKARIAYLERLHESILEAKAQCGDIKTEYAQVTSYLRDIQLIDQAPPEEKQTLYGAARRLVELTEERRRLRRQKYKITDAQKRAIENYETVVPADISRWQEYEDYQVKIKNDLRQLGSEKNLLLADKQDIIRRQGTLKTIGKCLLAVLIAIGAMLAALLFCFKVDITVPFVAAVGFAFVAAAIILNEARKNRIDMVITEKKCNRAVFLSNRVKLKYFNNVRTLDYLCHKYRVRNATELDFVFSQYQKEKREWARQRENTLQIHENSQTIIQELQRLGIKDKEIWLTQADALVEPKEMVEVRHDLNVRRQKLREQLDGNTGIMEECLEEMEMIRDKKPEYAAEVERILSQGPV